MNENIIIVTTIWDQDDLRRVGYTAIAEEIGSGDPVQELIDNTMYETKGSPNPYATMTDISWVDTYEDLLTATDVCTTIERSGDGAIQYYACDLQHVHNLVEFLRDNGIRDGSVDINVIGQMTVDDLNRYF